MAEKIITTEYSTEMQQAFISYSMSVITARAVPDIRDGLKPVQRRVLYAMNELGLNAQKPHRKSARIVGDAMGKYHPHGDSSIYDALVVLSQDFKKGMALVDGHGNFGSIEGDGAAAMRYTEARLKEFTQEVFLADLDKDVVDFVPNFDETEKEPEVLPVRVPNFLVNGSEGIAVGMTTSTPPHNLGEIIDAVKLVMENPKITTEELMQAVKGPDFPTGGIVTNQKDLLSIYETGRGKIKIRGKAEIEYAAKKSERDKIVITEIPYTMIGANIGKFLSDVASLVESKKLPDIVDISNQSSKEGIKIVLDLRKGANAENVLQGVLKKTKLEDTFGVNMLAIVNGRPEVMGLKRILEENIAFQIELNTRKYTTLLAKEQAKKEIQEGLIRAVDVIDLIIEIIRGSKTLKMAKECLYSGKTEGIRFKTEASRLQASRLMFTENQAGAILELRLSRLIGLEVMALQEEYKKTISKIASYEKLLKSPAAMSKKIRQDLDEIREKFGYERRTEILNAAEISFEEAPEEIVETAFVMNRFGYVKMLELSLFHKNEDAIREENQTVVFCKSNSRISIFTDEGLMYQLKMQEVPLCRLKDKGVPVDNLCGFDSSRENIVCITCLEELWEDRILVVTKGGMVKQMEISELKTIKKMVTSTKLNSGDRILFLDVVKSEELILLTDQKRAVRFAVSDIPLQKKSAVGVRGIKLSEDEAVEQVSCVDSGEKFSFKIGRRRVDNNSLPLKKRGGKAEQFL